MRISCEWTDKSAWDMKMAMYEVDESWYLGFSKTKNSMYFRIFGLEVLTWTTRG